MTSLHRESHVYGRARLATLSALALAVVRCATSEPSVPTPGSDAPEFALTVLASPATTGERGYPLAGHVASLGANRGRTVMLEFWATWCHPCLRLHPKVAQLARQYGDRGLVTSGIVYQDSPIRALTWLRDHGGVQYAQLSDATGAAARAYRVHAIPQMVLIGPDGRILSHCLGCATVVEDFSAALDSTLGIPPRVPHAMVGEGLPVTQRRRGAPAMSLTGASCVKVKCPSTRTVSPAATAGFPVAESGRTSVSRPFDLPGVT